jgi:hypothetical protein
VRLRFFLHRDPRLLGQLRNDASAAAIFPAESDRP